MATGVGVPLWPPASARRQREDSGVPDRGRSTDTAQTTTLNDRADTHASERGTRSFGVRISQELYRTYEQMWTARPDLYPSFNTLIADVLRRNVNDARELTEQPRGPEQLIAEIEERKKLEGRMQVAADMLLVEVQECRSAGTSEAMTDARRMVERFRSEVDRAGLRQRTKERFTRFITMQIDPHLTILDHALRAGLKPVSLRPRDAKKE